MLVFLRCATSLYHILPASLLHAKDYTACQLCDWTLLWCLFGVYADNCVSWQCTSLVSDVADVCHCPNAFQNRAADQRGFCIDLCLSRLPPPLPPLFPSFAAGSQGGHTLSYDTRCSSTTVCFMHWTCHPHAPCIAVCWVHDCQDGLLWQDKSSPACACACACACVLPKSSSPGKHRHDCCFGMIVTVIHIVISVIPVVGLSTFIIIVLSNYYN